MAQNRDKWRTVVNTAMKLRIPQKAENFLSSWATLSISRRALLHGISYLHTEQINRVSKRHRSAAKVIHQIDATVSHIEKLGKIVEQWQSTDTLAAYDTPKGIFCSHAGWVLTLEVMTTLKKQRNDRLATHVPKRK